MLSSILTRQSLPCLTNLTHFRPYFYRLIKPSISEYKSIQDLQFDYKQRQLYLIQKTNQQSLYKNKLYTKEKFISEILNVSEEITNEITKKSFNFSAIFPKSLKSHIIQKNYQNNNIDYPFNLQQLEPNLPNLSSIQMHFSYFRGVPHIPQYQSDKKVAYIFNLPYDFNTKQLSDKMGLQTIKQIKVQYCSIGLPAYAKIYFNTDQAVTNLVLNNKMYIEMNNKLCYIKTHFDKQKIQVKNRRLVIQNLQENQDDLMFRLSQYGRVMHLDYPCFISRNVSLQQIKQHFSLTSPNNPNTLLKINHHRKDNTIDIQYYPSLQQHFKSIPSTIIDFDTKIQQQKQQQQQIYQNRMKYAYQIDVYQGKQSQIHIKNMGYCIVTYSTLQQAQNCYFNLRFTNKITLFDQKKMEEFQIDSEYRKKILRYIDSQYRKTQQTTIEKEKPVYEKQLENAFDQLSLFNKLVDMESHVKALREKANQYTQDQPEVMISYFKTKVNQIKKNLQLKMNSKSFQQLAEQQLFGRVLPKKDIKKPKLSLDILPQQSPQLKQMLSVDRLQLTSKNIKQKQEYYRRLKARSTGKPAKSQTQSQQGLQVQSVQGQSQKQTTKQDDYTGKRNFSTIKKKQSTYYFKSRTPLEQANYILRYCQYIRNIINQYQGVFTENRLKANYEGNPTYLNPEKLKFSDGSQYIIEDDISKFLECMRNQEKAQDIYTDFWKTQEIIKSKNININQYKNNIRNNYFQAIQRFTDVGVIKDVYEVQQGEDINQKINYLNANIASFGQQFRIHEDLNNNNRKVIIKVSKLQHIAPLDRINKISQAKSTLDNKFGPKQPQKLALFQKYKYQILQTGQIPQQIRKQFDIAQTTTLDDLFQQLSLQTGIYKKDIQMLLNLQNFTEQQISQDISQQLQIQKSRINKRQSNANDYAKDPTNITIKDKQGYFKVSKFRQI